MMPDLPNRYYPNNIVRFTNTFTASGDLTINPTSVYAAVFHTAVESISATSVLNPSCGYFYFDYEVETPGILGVRWTSEGSHKTQSWGSVQVNTEPF